MITPGRRVDGKQLHIEVWEGVFMTFHPDIRQNPGVRIAHQLEHNKCHQLSNFLLGMRLKDASHLPFAVGYQCNDLQPSKCQS